MSDHMDEPPALPTHRKGSTIGSPQPSRAPLSQGEGMRPDMYPLQQSASALESGLPGASYSHKELASGNPDSYEDPHRPYQQEAYFPPSRAQVFHTDDLETPNMSASDSDSMQVNIPWRNSTRFSPNRTQSLPVESEGTNQDPPSPLTPRNPRHSYSQPLSSSPLHLRAVAEEQSEGDQMASSRPPTVASGKRRGSVEDPASVNESEGSETTSTLSSLARLKLRLTGSVPFLPLIEESSPLDTDNLWSRLRGDTPRSSIKSLSSPSRTRPRSSPRPPPSSSSHHSHRPHSPSHSGSSHPFASPFPNPATSRPTTPKSTSSKLASPKPASPTPASPPASPPPSVIYRDRPVSPKPLPPATSPDSTPGMAAPGIKLTPDMPAISSPLSHISPWQTHYSPVTLSTQDSLTSASSLALRDLSDFPEPPSARTLPRPLPMRPLPHIPPPPSYLPPKPPVRILDQGDVDSNVSGALSRHTSPLDERHIESEAPIPTSPQSSPVNNNPLPNTNTDPNHGVKIPPSSGPSKLSLIIQ
ncbi:hypothetical protein JB92DRAFT_2838017 [Gautieria morchelliformis]|nr:hypothetical protein JB92DRAFT_2838017 [Gautieria morchelliformis]